MVSSIWLDFWDLTLHDCEFCVCIAVQVVWVDAMFTFLRGIVVTLARVCMGLDFGLRDLRVSCET